MVTQSAIRERSHPMPNLSEIVTRLSSQFQDDVTADSLALEAGLSASHLRQRFREYTGVSLHQYLKDYRLKYAATRLLTEETSIATVADECGFHSMPGFSTAFRRRFSCSPSQMRNRAPQIVSQRLGHLDPDLRFEVQLVHREPVRVAYMCHSMRKETDAQEYEQIWMKFLSRIGGRLLRQRNVTFFDISWDDTTILGGSFCRVETAMSVDDTFQETSSIAVRELPGGTFAAVDVCGNMNQIEAAWDWLVWHWLRNSSWQLAATMGITQAAFPDRLLSRATTLISWYFDRIEARLLVPVRSATGT